MACRKLERCRKEALAACSSQVAAVREELREADVEIQAAHSKVDRRGFWVLGMWPWGTYGDPILGNIHLKHVDVHQGYSIAIRLDL